MTFYMNKTMKSILTLIAFGATALGLAAQPALKIVTVGLQDGTFAEIKTGIKAGDVVSTGLQATQNNTQAVATP